MKRLSFFLLVAFLVMLVGCNKKPTEPENVAPNAPSSPTPSNGAVDQSINIDLSWTGGDPDGDKVTYDVYFGTSSPPPSVSTEQTATSYDPGNLNHNIKYYWKIVAKDEHGAKKEGSIWAFTTIAETNNPPNEPSSPSPTDGAIDQLTNVNLSWTGGDPDGDPVTYDVYFGTSSSPPLVSSDQSATTYDPGNLNYSTHYYWKIVAKDSIGAQTEGSVWDFTTVAYQNNPPYVPSNPSPSNGAVDQSINVNLSWTGGDPDGDPVTYDVYFATSTPPTLVSAGQSATTYDPGTLNYNTQYYWKIVAEDSFGAQTQGSVWDFTTESAFWEEYKNASGTYYQIMGNYYDPDPDSGAPWIALSSYGTDGAEAYWDFYGLNQAVVETLTIGAYSYDNGWDTYGEEYWVYNHTTSVWDYWASSDKTHKWHLWYAAGSTARNYVRSLDGGVFLCIMSGYPDHSHIREVYCKELGTGGKLCDAIKRREIRANIRSKDTKLNRPTVRVK